jgi:hypothetical protein
MMRKKKLLMMNYNEFRAKHKGLPQHKVSALWKKYKATAEMDLPELKLRTKKDKKPLGSKKQMAEFISNLEGPQAGNREKDREIEQLQRAAEKAMTQLIMEKDREIEQLKRALADVREQADEYLAMISERDQELADLRRQMTESHRRTMGQTAVERIGAQEEGEMGMRRQEFQVPRVQKKAPGRTAPVKTPRGQGVVGSAVPRRRLEATPESLDDDDWETDEE